MNLPVDYPWAVAAALGMSWQLWAFGLPISKFRRQAFNEQFMKKQFGTLHKNQIGDDIPMGGFPDTGSGVYSQRLSYGDWYRFNVLQRIHLNYVEGISLAQTSILAAGLYKPKQAALIGLAYIIGRFIFAIGAKTKRGSVSKTRIFAVALSVLAVLINTGIFGFNFAKSLKNK